MVEGTGLENRHTLKGIGGSNPPSPVVFYVLFFLKNPAFVDYQRVISSIGRAPRLQRVG